MNNGKEKNMSHYMSRKDFLHLTFLTDFSTCPGQKNQSRQKKYPDIDLPPEFNSFLLQESQALGIDANNNKEDIKKQLLQELWNKSI